MVLLSVVRCCWARDRCSSEWISLSSWGSALESGNRSRFLVWGWDFRILIHNVGLGPDYSPTIIRLELSRYSRTSSETLQWRHLTLFVAIACCPVHGSMEALNVWEIYSPIGVGQRIHRRTLSYTAPYQGMIFTLVLHDRHLYDQGIFIEYGSSEVSRIISTMVFLWALVISQNYSEDGMSRWRLQSKIQWGRGLGNFDTEWYSSETVDHRGPLPTTSTTVYYYMHLCY